MLDIQHHLFREIGVELGDIIVGINGAKVPRGVGARRAARTGLSAGGALGTGVRRGGPLCQRRKVQAGRDHHSHRAALCGRAGRPRQVQPVRAPPGPSGARRGATHAARAGAPEEAAPLLPRAKGAGGAQRLTADARRGGRLDFRVQLGVAQVKNAPRF